MKALVIYPRQFEETQVFDFPVDDFNTENMDVDSILDLIFRQCNHVDGNEWIEGKKLRSMSVGDMVKLTFDLGYLGERVDLFCCQNIGWKKL